MRTRNRRWGQTLLVALASVIGRGEPRADDAGAATPLHCEPAPVGDSRPWIHTRRVLNSFRPDIPAPRFAGAFAGAGPSLDYEIHLWRDSKGIFGELLSPVLDADSSSGQLLDVQFDGKSGRLTFTARVRGEEHKFAGRLRPRTMKGVFTYRGVDETIVLRRLGAEEGHGVPPSTSWVSRDQFACAMMMWGR
jgi:hypothetical protein